MKVELCRAFTESGMREMGLACRLEIPETTVERLFDLHFRTRIEQLAAPVEACGKPVEIPVRAL